MKPPKKQRVIRAAQFERNKFISVALTLGGAIGFTVGLFLFSLPLGFIVSGVLLAAAGYRIDATQNRRKGSE